MMVVSQQNAPPNSPKKNERLGQSDSTQPETVIPSDDGSSCHTGSEEFSGDDSSFFDDDELPVQMSVNDIAKLLGSVKFDEITPDIDHRNGTRSLSSNAIAEDDSDKKSTDGIHRSLSILQRKPGQVDDIQNTIKEEVTNPSKILSSILKENEYDFDVISWDSSRIPECFFEPNKEENMKAYTTEILGAVRTQDVQKLKQLFVSGHSMQCRNKFGESILHLACRRGFGDVVDFLINEARININIRDDFGRTPFHDVCWVVKPQFQIVTILLKASPDLLVIGDSRGFAPLQYVKQDQYEEWSRYLKMNKDLVVPKCIKR